MNVKKKMLIDYPDLVAEWDYEKNAGLDIANFSHGSDKLVWWKCLKHGHSWEIKITKRTRGNNCGICANKVVLKGFNDVASTYPVILEYWDFDKNLELSVYEITGNSRKDAYFKCVCGYSWKNKVCNFVMNVNKCNNCAGNIVNESNCLATLYPDLAKEWRGPVAEGDTITPYNASIGNPKTVFWQCSLNHPLYPAMIADRVIGKHNCPYCSNHKILVGYNDLATTHPEIVKYWNYEKNVDIQPTQVTFGSSEEVWWTCDYKHSFSSIIKSRIYNNSGCPVCSNRLIVQGINDVLTTHPEIIDMIDPELTNVEELSNYSAGSNKLIWWKCDKVEKHKSWESAIRDRLLMEIGCRPCSATKSKMESELGEYINSVLVDEVNVTIVENSRKIISPYELDFYIPELNIAFEFNGKYWHSDEYMLEVRGISADDYHDRKVDMCAAKNIKLFFVWETDWLNDKENVKKWVGEEILKSLNNISLSLPMFS